MNPNAHNLSGQPMMSAAQAEKAMAARAMEASLPSVGGAGRQSTKDMLLAKVEQMRREAHELEALAYQVEHIRGDAEAMLYRLLAAHVYR